MADLRNNHGKRSNFQSDHIGNGGSKRRSPADDNEQSGIGSEDTVYRYLCHVKKVGGIIGKGGEIAKQIRLETNSNMRISEALPGCEERIVTIYSSSEETNHFGEDGELVSPAFDALFKVHDRIVSDELAADEDFEETQVITVRMLVPSDQIGCVIGKGGQVIQNLRSETHAQIRVLRDQYLPACALTNDELLQVIGEPSVVRKALYEVAVLLHDNPSRFQHLLLSSLSSMHQSSGHFMGAPFMNPYGNYSTRKDDVMVREFSLCFICPVGNIGGVIGKGGGFINQIRQESGATIKVDSSGAEGDDCIISISSKEFFEAPSPAINAAQRLQSRCSERVDNDSGDPAIVTRLLVPSSHIGCIIGKGGVIISEIRRTTRANIRILKKEDLPKVVHEEEDMVQITGVPDVASKALSQVSLRLRANLFEKDGALASPSPFFPYVPLAVDMTNASRHRKRDTRSHGSDSVDLPSSEIFRSYGAALSGDESAYGGYGGKSSTHRLPGRNPKSVRRNHGY